MFKFIKRAFCKHNFSWSERRGGDVCIRCGQFRAEGPAHAQDQADGY